MIFLFLIQAVSSTTGQLPQTSLVKELRVGIVPKPSHGAWGQNLPSRAQRGRLPNQSAAQEGTGRPLLAPPGDFSFPRNNPAQIFKALPVCSKARQNMNNR